MSDLAAKTVLVAGLGNIGSTLPALLLQAGVGKLRLVDRDVVEAKNLQAQDYHPNDVGRLKAEAVAERLRGRFPDREITAYPVDLANLPQDVACVDLVMGALDSRRARQLLISELAWRLGVPAIDGGVGDGGLGRVQVFAATEQAACLECTWGAADYRLAAAEYPCVPGEAARGVPTGAPAHLGALTAALMASVATGALCANPQASFEIAFDLTNFVLRRFDLRRAPHCRFDHARRTPCTRSTS